MSNSPPQQSSSSQQRRPAPVHEQATGESGRRDRIETESESHRDRSQSGRRLRERNEESNRLWGDIAQETRGRVDYLVYAQVYEVNAHRQPPSPSPPPPPPPQQQHRTYGPSHVHPSPGMAADVRSPTGNSDYPSTSRQHGSTTRHEGGGGPHLHRRSAGSNNIPNVPFRQLSSSLTQPPNFSVEDQAYLRGRLPMRQPASAQTVNNHYRRLPFLYQDLAEGCRARLSEVSAGTREWEKRQRMAELAQRLSNKYMKFRLVLPRSYIGEAIGRWQGELPRTSRFWEKVFEEIEKANSSWSIVRLWILLFIIQSTLVTVAYNMLPTPGKVALLITNALAYVWSTTVMCEMLHSRYMEVKTDEQELHDLLGGLRG